MRVLLVDDNRDFVQSAAFALDSDGTAVVVGRALSPDAAMDMIAKLRPDVVLMDIAMPGISGLELTRRIKAGADAPCVVLLTVHDEPEYRDAARDAGADGFVVKDRWSTELPTVLKNLPPRAL